MRIPIRKPVRERDFHFSVDIVERSVYSFHPISLNSNESLTFIDFPYLSKTWCLLLFKGNIEYFVQFVPFNKKHMEGSLIPESASPFGSFLGLDLFCLQQLQLRA